MSQSSESNDSSESIISNSSDSDYIPSQTPETEDYTSYESSEPLSEAGRSLSLTPTESEYSTDSGSYDYSSLDKV